MLILFCWGLLWAGDGVIITEKARIDVLSVPPRTQPFISLCTVRASLPYITTLYFISDCNRCSGIMLQLWTVSHKAFFHRSGLNQPNYLLLHQTLKRKKNFPNIAKWLCSAYFFFVLSKCQWLKNVQVALGVYILSMVSCEHNVIIMMHWSAAVLFKWTCISQALFTKWLHGHDSFVNAELKYHTFAVYH